MLRILFLAVFFAVATLPARAELPDLLARALEKEPADRDVQTLSLRIIAGEASIVIAIDGEDGKRGRTRLVEPADETEMDEAQAALWRSWSPKEDEEESPEKAAEKAAEKTGDDPQTEEEESTSVSLGGYDREGLIASIGTQVTPLGERDGLQVYAFKPQKLLMGGDGDAGGFEKALDHMIGEVAVDPVTEHIARVGHRLEGSFKPNMVVRINTFDIETTYVFDARIDGPRMDAMSFKAVGSAMFQSFDEGYTIQVADIQYKPLSEGAGDAVPSDQAPQ